MRNYLVFFALCLGLQGALMGRESADYVVVGLGTAGATMAKLLSDDESTSVIAIHNGKNQTQDPDIKYTKNAAFTVLSAPFGAFFYQRGDTIPQPFADGNEIVWVVALPEGGASSINAGAWLRGTTDSYSEWEAFAGPEWSSLKILDIFVGLENYHGLTTNPAERGTSGPLSIRQIPTPTPFSTKFTQAVELATGVPFLLDYNVENIGVASQMQYTQSGNEGQFRVSSATAFLNESVVTPSGKGVGERKLKIKYKSTALRTIWEENRAVGVEYWHNGKIKKVYANKGVVVCAGLYSSAFLMHSGIGSERSLKALGIPVKYNNPNVGKALADQPIVPIIFATNPADTPVDPDNSLDSSFPSDLTFHISDRSFQFQIPDIPSTEDQKRFWSTLLQEGFAFPQNSIFSQIALLPDPAGDPNERKVRITTINPFPGLALAMVDLVQPVSRGRITLNSFNPFEKPVIDSGIFSQAEDLELYITAFQTYIKNINASLQAIDEQYQLVFPDPAILDDTEVLSAFIKEAVTSAQCWQSHCRMAPLAQGGVVDGRGKVYGVENLFVADNSVNPVLMDGTTMATAYLVAANIARLLIAD